MENKDLDFKTCCYIDKYIYREFLNNKYKTVNDVIKQLNIFCYDSYKGVLLKEKENKDNEKK